MEKQKNTPVLRFPEFEEIWERKKLGELLEFKNGINASKEQYGHGVKFINVLDILNNDFITYDSILGCVDVDIETVNKFPVNYGDVLFQRSSETREEVGSACVYLDNEKTATFGGFVIRGRKIGEYIPVFLNKLLKTDKARDEITSKSGGSTRYNVGQETLSSVALLFPALSEQLKIASFLTSVDEKLTQLKHKKSLLEQYKKGIMQKLFSQKLRFKDKNGNDFPEWEVKNFSHVLESISTRKFQIKSTEFNLEGKYKVVDQGKELFAGYSDNEENVFKNYPVIVFGDHTTVLKYIDSEFIVGADGTKLLKNKKDDNLKYLFYNLSINNVRQEGYKRHFTMLSKIYLQIPSLAEQNLIANFLSAIDEKINHCQLQIEKTVLYKKGLLQKMFC